MKMTWLLRIKFLIVFTHFMVGVNCGAQVVRAVPTVWVNSCQSCHGATGQDGSASSLLDADWLVGKGTDEDLFRSIHDGVPVAGMPAYGDTLSDADIRLMVVFIRELRSNHERGVTKPGQGRANYVGRSTVAADHHTFTVEPVLEGLDRLWAMAILPNGQWVINERDGDMWLAKVAPNHKPILNSSPVNGTPKVRNLGQGGLLDLVLDPNYPRNGWIYISYSEPRRANGQDNQGMTVIARGRIRDNTWMDHEILYRAEDKHYTDRRQHFGSRIALDSKGMLFFTVGDRGQQQQAQSLSHPFGKVHRIHSDGRVPKDNPFVQLAGALPTVWSYGHRNPQGLDFHPSYGQLWESEHGPRGGDEINLIRRGLNYGWPVITYGVKYNGTPITDKTEAPGMEQPAIQYTPSLALIGIDHYTGNLFPEWRNDLFVASIASGHLRRIRADRTGKIIQDELLFSNQGRLRDVYDAPDGHLYVLTSEGRILRLSPSD